MACRDPAQQPGARVPDGRHRGDERRSRGAAAHGLVHRPGGVLEPGARAARGAQRAHGQRRQGGRLVAFADGVAQGQPDAALVVGVVEEVTAHLVSRQHAAGEGGAGDAREAGREEVLLDLRRRLGPLAPARGVDGVGVAAAELEGERRLGGELGERRDRRRAEDDDAEGAVAEHEGLAGRAGDRERHRGAERRERLERDLGPDAEGRLDGLGERSGRLRQQVEGRAVHVHHVERRVRARQPGGGRGDALGEVVVRGLLAQQRRRAAGIADPRGVEPGASLTRASGRGPAGDRRPARPRPRAPGRAA